MANIDIISSDCSNDNKLRSQSIKKLINNQNGDMSLNLLLDIFQNLILDCKSVISNTNNRHFQSFYQLYKEVNEKLYDLRLNANDFFTLKIIGQGAFGQVQLVRHRETKCLFAMKLLNKAQMMSQEGSVFWKEERDIMSGIDSRWIVKLHYAFQDPRRLYMVMEYLPGGNLVTWMSKLDVVIEADVSFYAAEIVLAICVLHENNLVHRDIKPDNMLLDCRGHIKLTDFGTCVRVDPISKHINCNRPVGTPDYISPEVLLSQSSNTGYGFEVDWWAFGVMLYEIFYGDTPFYSDSLVQTYGKIMVHEQHLTFPPDDQISDRAVSLIRGLICDRAKRLGASVDALDIKSHDFFNLSTYKWDWNNIQDLEAPFIPVLESQFDTSNFTFTEDDESKEAFDVGDKELNPTVFCGDNLQFSGFSYGDIFSESKDKIPKTSSVLSEKSIDESVNSIMAENKCLSSKVNSLNKENEDIKSSLEKISIERKDLENQIQNALEKLKSEVKISKKLQSDYSDLMSKHGMCQQKFSRLEEEKHKLCADLASFQNNSSDETQRLLATIEQQRQEYEVLNAKLSESQSDYRKSKLETVKLENDIKYLQRRCEALENELTQVQQTNDTSSKEIKQNLGYSNARLTLELKELRSDYDEKWKEMQQHLMENQALSNLVTGLQKENETIKLSLAKAEEQLSKDAVATLNNQRVIIEKNSVIEDLMTKVKEADNKLENSIKSEKDLNIKLVRLTAIKKEEKVKFDNEIEEQRRKLNAIITHKNLEVQQLHKDLDITISENGNLKSELQLEKAKCSGLVEKINDILTGKSSTAREIMLAEEVKSGKVDRRSGRYYNQVLKDNKRLQCLQSQQEKDMERREREMRNQIENLSREKDHVEYEFYLLRSFVDQQRNDAMDPQTTASMLTYTSHGSFDSGFPGDGPRATSTPIRYNMLPRSRAQIFNIPSANVSANISPSSTISSQSIRLRIDRERNDEHLDLTVRQNRSNTLDLNRLSITESVMAELPCPDGQLDVSVKIKGKKMTWEKRFVKLEDENLLFYNQSLETCLIKLPVSCLLFVRRVSNADVIHIKKAEVPRIFQIFFDKNRTLYAQMIRKQSMTGSNCSINTLGSSKSSERESAINDLNDTNIGEIVPKQSLRRGSVAKLFPLFGMKHKSKGEGETPTMNSISGKAVLIKGHIFELCIAESKKNCDLCQSSLGLSSSVHQPASPGPSTDNRVLLETGVRLMSRTPNLSLLSSKVDPSKCYKCYHCRMSVHGSELDEKTSACKESVGIQLCRTSSEQQLKDWLNYLTHAIQSQPNTSTAMANDARIRSATLG